MLKPSKVEYDFDSKHLGSTGVRPASFMYKASSRTAGTMLYIETLSWKTGGGGDNKILKLEEEETKFQGSEWTIYLRINFSLLLSKILSNKSQSIIAEIDEFLE